MKTMLLLVALATAGAAGCATGAGHHSTTARRAAPAAKSFASRPAAGARAMCTVMGHAFTVQADTAFSVHKGRYYVFCCPGCKTRFDADPARYAGQ